MYTTEKSPIAKLRRFRAELNAMYAAALARGDWRAARKLAAQRRKVQRAVLLHEEWDVKPAQTPLTEVDRFLQTLNLD
ncbi:MAG: hypothetical protein M0Z94_16820 [Dehalococcoidales bacterium]|nr:hypothetical protein [Dehalococcoidales bacterium]